MIQENTSTALQHIHSYIVSGEKDYKKYSFLETTHNNGLRQQISTNQYNVSQYRSCIMIKFSILVLTPLSNRDSFFSNSS